MWEKERKLIKGLAKLYPEIVTRLGYRVNMKTISIIILRERYGLLYCVHVT